LFVDEESTWHKSNRGIEQNIDGFYTKTTQKGGFSKLYAKTLNALLDARESNSDVFPSF
jgi:hypothetical protein